MLPPASIITCARPGLSVDLVCPTAAGDGPGNFEANLASLNLREGVDYLHFS